MSNLLPLDGWPTVLNITIKDCKCSLPERGEYIGNGDAYICKKCKGVISGYNLSKVNKNGLRQEEEKER